MKRTVTIVITGTEGSTDVDVKVTFEPPMRKDEDASRPEVMTAAVMLAAIKDSINKGTATPTTAKYTRARNPHLKFLG